MTTVTLWFDFISPYAWLAMVQAETFAAERGVAWDPRPIVYGKMLDATGLVGPVETSAKRRYTWLDVARAAARIGRPLVGPPAHPFRSLEALRTACLFLDRPEALALVVALADAAWRDGRDLADRAVLEDVVASCGLDADRLGERIAEPAVKQRLRDLTEDAIARGVFGVPTFGLGVELFWGHDRMAALAERLAGAAPPDPEVVRRLIERPAAAWRARAPVRDDRA